MRSNLFFLLAWLPTLVFSLAATDMLQDADPAQSGYLDNHNMHPSTVGSAIFGVLWKNFMGNNKERWYAKPLVYTPPGRSQLVFLASAMNVIRTVDAVNGTLINSRIVQPPFLQADVGCTDVPDYIGIMVGLGDVAGWVGENESDYRLGNSSHRSRDKHCVFFLQGLQGWSFKRWNA